MKKYLPFVVAAVIIVGALILFGGDASAHVPRGG